jgi:hypothetical protein
MLTKQFLLLMEPDLHRRLLAQRDRLGASAGHLVREALTAYLASLERASGADLRRRVWPCAR